ncbi:MAG: hypothetical protein AB7V46_03895, partial [Thermomicrobiales bacterium]
MQSGRPSAPPRARSRGYRREQRWPSISWWLSAIFIVALAAWALTFLIRALDGDDDAASQSSTIAITVLDAQTGAPIAGAEVRAGSAVGQTNDSGTILVPLPEAPIVLTISHASYHPVYGELDSTMASSQQVALNPVEAETTAEQQPDLQNTPAADPAEAQQQEPATGTTTPAQQDSAGVFGRVVDAAGNPIGRATILAGGQISFSDDGGYFEAPAAQIGQQFRVWASGYVDQFPTATIPDEMTIQLERLDIKAAYLTGARLADRARIDQLIETINTTEL